MDIAETSDVTAPPKVVSTSLTDPDRLDRRLPHPGRRAAAPSCLCDDVPLDRVLLAMLAMQRQSWEQGIAAQALLAVERSDLALLLVDAAVTRQDVDGRLGNVDGEGGAVNGGACGEALLQVIGLAGEQDSRWAAAAAHQLEWLLDRAPRAADGTLFHLMAGRQVWADTIYMVAPMLSRAGRTDVALAQIAGHQRRLYDETCGLYAARWDEDIAAVVAPQRWGTGNGWVVSGIARALGGTTEWSSTARDALAGHARAVIDACLTHRRADGLFHDVLDDPTTFVETNVAQMLAYAALTGVGDGWLPAGYTDVGHDLLTAAQRQVDPAGVVTPVCGSPDFTRPGSSTEAQAFHLLAHAAARAVSSGVAPATAPQASPAHGRDRPG